MFLLLLNKRERHHKPLPINHLCDLWSNGHFGIPLEQQVTLRTRQFHTSSSDHYIHLAIGLAREGLYGQILSVSGVAPNNDTTWQLLQAKHPRSPLSVFLSNDRSNVLLSCLITFDILSVLRSFPKSTVCGPSRWRIQLLLDAAEGSICNVVSKFFAGGN